MRARMPAIYVPHGGGPWPFVEMGFGTSTDGLRRYLESLRELRPAAVLVVSAHWEEREPTVQSSARPPMLYDYYGFPPEAYTLQWPAPGAPELAQRVRSLLDAAGIVSAEDRERGFDHGAFVVTGVAWPDADVPTLQLSLRRGLDPQQHLAIGRALAPLRDEGVLVLGSGMSYHHMQGFRAAMAGAREPRDDSRRFDDWLAESVALPRDARDDRLVAWEAAPAARACHPREEHLLPLMVVAGAAGEDVGTLPYRELLMGVHVSAVRFG